MPTVLYSAGLRFPILQSYSTSFAGTENPLSEGGIWTNGGTTGLDWTDVRKTPGLAFATQVPHTSPPFDDSIACLSGYHPDQWVSGVIRNPGNAAAHREVELHLRQRISAHSAISIELDITIDFGLQVVRWNGPVNSFTPIASNITAGVTTNDGDVYYAQFVGTALLVKCNSATVYTGTDALVTTGSPGLGFYAETNSTTPSADNSFGFSSFSCGEL